MPPSGRLQCRIIKRFNEVPSFTIKNKHILEKKMPKYHLMHQRLLSKPIKVFCVVWEKQKKRLKPYQDLHLNTK